MLKPVIPNVNHILHDLLTIRFFYDQELVESYIFTSVLPLIKARSNNEGLGYFSPCTEDTKSLIMPYPYAQALNFGYFSKLAVLFPTPGFESVEIAIK